MRDLESRWPMGNPDSPHSAAYVKRIGELEETIRVQGERLKLLDFIGREEVEIVKLRVARGGTLSGLNVTPLRVYVEEHESLERAIREAMDAVEGRTYWPPTPNTHP
jgi:hypothetical protein